MFRNFLRFWPLILSALSFLGALGNCTSASAQTPGDSASEPAVEPALAEKTFKLSEGLAWKLLLSEPQITQPLMASFDAHGRLWLVEYKQYPNPEGLKVLSKDRHWRVVYDSVPKPPGFGGLAGRDRISVHEDKDRDGNYDTHHIFVDELNIATSVLPVDRGAWVLNPPYLLFYADIDGDLKADGPPEVHLEGFGLEDTHSVVNNLTLGPDGWIYGAQGSTVSGAVKAPGSSEKPIQSLGQAIWRYHPKIRKYEIFAEGGGNAFGVAFDDRGEIFSGHNGGDTRGFHYYQGGYYRKGFSKHGSLSNPHSYGYLEPMQHDPIPRFTHTMLLTESTGLAAPKSSTPKSKQMLGVDPLHGKLIQTELQTVGSTYKTKDIADAVSSSDKWYRPVAICDGPDGAAYVCDWYDSVVAHLYAFEGRLDRDRGRVYRLKNQTPDPNIPLWNPQLADARDEASLEQAIGLLNHPYRWQRWQARWLIANHPLRKSAIEKLSKALLASDQDIDNRVIGNRDADASLALEYLWTLHALGAIADTIPYSPVETPLAPWVLLKHPLADVRSWTVRLACDDGQLDPRTLQAIEELAANETDPHTLCQIACSARRLTASSAMAVIAKLLDKPRAQDDPFFGLLVWWAVESHAGDFPAIEHALLAGPERWNNPIALKILFPNLVRRWASMAKQDAYDSISMLLKTIGPLTEPLRSEATNRCQESFEAAFVGRSLTGVPDSLIDAMVALGQAPLTLQVRRGDRQALAQAAKRIEDPDAPAPVRMQLARLAGELDDAASHPELLDALLKVAGDTNAKSPVRISAISALANFHSETIPNRLIQGWPDLASELRPAAGSVLSTRTAWISLWLDAIDSQRVSADELPPESVRTMRLHPDEALQKRIAAAYPEFASVSLAAASETSKRLAEKILSGNGDPYQGKKLYREMCGRCHQLFDDGGKVGPDLTGYQRDQLEALLRNIVGPSLEIREGYQMVRILTADSLVLTGFIESEQSDQIVLRNTDGQSITLQRSEIEQLDPQILSLMPEGLLDKLNDAQLRDLMAYLRSSQPLNDGT
jgi:putative membrane-bound dehydrogenase-like protein